MGDPFSLKARSFSVADSLVEGLKLVGRELGPIIGVSLVFAIPAAALQLFVPGDDARSVGLSTRISNFYDSLIGIIGTQALLVRLMTTAEGRRVPLRAALSVSLSTWGRCFGARFRAGLWIALFTLLLILPGVWKYVQFLFVTIAVLRSVDDPLEVSKALVEGRWWPVFAVSFAAGLLFYGPALVVVFVVGFVAEFTSLPPFFSSLASEWAFAVAQVGVMGVLLVAYYGLHRSLGRALGPLPFKAPLTASTTGG